MTKRLPVDMAPDLASVDAVSLSVMVGVPQAAVTSLLQSLDSDPARAAEIDYVGNYSRARKRHQAYAHFLPRRGRAVGRHIHLLYDLEPVKFEEETRNIADLFDAVTRLDVETEARCEAEFRYPDDHWSSAVKLPWRPLEMEVLPFDEFRGFRAVKLRNGDVLYSIIVDRAANSDIAQSLTFSYPARLDGHLPLAVLRRAVEISRLFVTSRRTSQ